MDISPEERRPTATENGAAGPLEPHLRSLDEDIAAAGGELPEDTTDEGVIGVTMFDLPGSEDNSVTVLLPKDNLQKAPSQALLRICSHDGRRYVGIVAAGPFAEPDSLRGDSPMLVTVATRGGIYLPPYHGRVQVELLGEEQADGSLAPPRLRPLPNSRAYALDDVETAQLLHADGDVRLGLVAGHQTLPVGIPSTLKSVLPRHTAVLGTTGAGKSTTVARLVEQAQAAGMAVILLDVEGEYTYLDQPTDDPRMLSGLAARGLAARGVPFTLYHLVGRDTANPNHQPRREFSLQFARLSPYAVMEILELTEAQADRFLKAYEVAKALLRELGVFPERGNAEQERLALEIDEFERGYPRLTLSMLLDVVAACVRKVDGQEPEPFNAILQQGDGLAALKRHLGQLKIDSPVSWRALHGKLWRLNRLKVFDQSGAKPLNYRPLLKPGAVSVIDLSDSGASVLSNLVIADLLQGIQNEQDALYRSYEERPSEDQLPPRVLIIIEEAHEFLSAERIDQMPVLFEQVGRIAKRGRKRWLGLVFVTQFPQHLPRQVFGLVNSYILHKLTDPQVVSTLQRTVSGIDVGLWRRLPGLAPGQAIVSFPHLAHPLLVSIDPTPAKLRMVE